MNQMEYAVMILKRYGDVFASHLEDAASNEENWYNARTMLKDAEYILRLAGYNTDEFRDKWGNFVAGKE